ncbi:MAG: NINE protein [Acidobacteria bacterium]|nr:NINE protein [Acidobacteriota bacterium]
MSPDQRYCTQCGWDAEHPDRVPPGGEPGPIFPPRDLGPPSDKNRLTALLLCILLGWLGAHRFYVGRPLSGLLWAISLGLLGVGVIYDSVMIATGEMRDDQDKRLLHWQ